MGKEESESYVQRIRERETDMKRSERQKKETYLLVITCWEHVGSFALSSILMMIIEYGVRLQVASPLFFLFLFLSMVFSVDGFSTAEFPFLLK